MKRPILLLFLLLLSISFSYNSLALNETNDSKLTGDTFSVQMNWDRSSSGHATTTPEPDTTPDTTPTPAEEGTALLETTVPGEGTTSPESEEREVQPGEFSAESLQELDEEEIALLLDEKAGTAEDVFLGEEHRRYFLNPETREKSSRLISRIGEADATGNWQPFVKEVKTREMERFIIQFNKSCNLSGIPKEVVKQRLVTDNYVFMVLLLPAPLVPNILENDCVLKGADEEEIDTFLAYARELLKEEAAERMRLLQLRKSSHDVTSYDEIKALLEWDKSKGEYSPLQQYVTPKDERVMRVANGKSPEELYDIALRWLWVSDSDMYNESEKWLFPQEFLEQTPSDPGNPLPGNVASDCSEQANTLVSLLRASGFSPKEVRVGIGEVEFEEGSSGGHAWVEILINDTWIVLDPTVGLYYDDSAGEVEREFLPYEYWQYHPFPIVDVWAYYNDKYFLDLEVDKAPKNWDDGAGDLFGKKLKKGFAESLWDSFLLWISLFIAGLL